MYYMIGEDFPLTNTSRVEICALLVINSLVEGWKCELIEALNINNVAAIDDVTDSYRWL